MPTDAPIQLDALGPTGSYRARARTAVLDVAGNPVAELSTVPVPFVARAMSALRAAAPTTTEQRLAALAAAGEHFRNDEIAGLDFEAYLHTVSRVSGLGLTVVRAAAEKVAGYFSLAHEAAQYARPQLAATSWGDDSIGRGVAMWVRKGDVLSVLAAGNHPGVNTSWLQAVALGYRVAVRPSRREPFTAHRMISALRAAGLADDQLVYLPTDHQAADELVRSADLSLVYGGDDVVRKYGADPRVSIQGPGRSKVLITADVDWREHLEVIVDSIAKGGGTGCTNATAVFVEREGDAEALALALADRLGRLPSLSPESADAILPVQPFDVAERLGRFVSETAHGSRALLGGEGIVDRLEDGSAVLRPAVHLLDGARDARANVELPFPCVWVAPWERGDVAALDGTLVLTALTRDEELVARLIGERSIRNVYVGDVPTHWTSLSVPHDGFLADFLMESKGAVRAA